MQQENNYLSFAYKVIKQCCDATKWMKSKKCKFTCFQNNRRITYEFDQRDYILLFRRIFLLGREYINVRMLEISQNPFMIRWCGLVQYYVEKRMR